MTPEEIAREELAQIIAGCHPQNWPQEIDPADRWASYYRKVADQVIAEWLPAALAASEQRVKGLENEKETLRLWLVSAEAKLQAREREAARVKAELEAARRTNG